MDVLEMDAASNRGIDEIRDLRDKVNLTPTQGRMKVYIIDEVHMLTTEAFNALLKMLEEPPEHVVFVLATTEKHKVLPTIISRCQSFDFRRPGVALLAEKLREIADAEGIEAEPAALTLISREARGSFRDAEGLLDQLSSFADGPITAARVRELLGSLGSEVLLETTDALYERRAADALRVVDRLQNEGKDLSRFSGELIAHLRRLMLLPHAPEVALAEVGAEERAGLEEQASRVPTAEVVRMIGSLGDALSRAKRGGDSKLELELTFMKLARDYAEPQVDALLGRLEALERAVAKGTTAAIVPPRTQEAKSGFAEQDAPAETAAPEAMLAAPLEVVADEEPLGEKQTDGGEAEDGGPGKAVAGEAAPEGEAERGDGREGAAGIGDLATRWGHVIQDLKDRKQALTATVFAEGQPSRLEDGVLEITFPVESDFYAREAGKSRHAKALGEVLEGRFGVKPHLELRVAGADGSAKEVPVESVPAPKAPPPDSAFPEAPSGGGNGSVPLAHTPPRETFEAAYGETPAADEEPPRIVEAPERETKPGVTGPSDEREGPDNTIQDPQEVLAIARDLFGSGGGLAGDKHDGG
jgi:DNA polymerase-3 subunit gamma/tau